MMSFRETKLFELFAQNEGCVLWDERLAAFLFGEALGSMRDGGRQSLKQCMSRLRPKLPKEVLLVRVSKRGYTLVKRGATL